MTDKKPPARSRYDELFDKYHRLATSKAGTRYEMLAALVLKALNDKHAVIHDLNLRGESEVKHQIDVTVEVSGQARRRIIIECKDFDLSGAKVDLGIIRNFWAVFADTRADEAVVITCNDYTKEARQFAKSKGITLAILRIFEKRDREGRIETILLNITVQRPADANATLVVDEDHLAGFQAQLADIGITNGVKDTDDVHFTRDGERVQFNAFLTTHMNDAIRDSNPQAISIDVPADGWQLQVSDNTPLPFQGIRVTFGIDEQTLTRKIVSDRVAELILSGMGDKDLIVFGDHIARYAIDPTTGDVS
ncbi:restriction endonuclease [Hyphomicrobium sp. DY-1]|uniref:restriction endonuclease n=1 Tax=Hyphomicrobium sp. DY-1 TaxID=3075650 RepID=UPI0039C40B00